MMSFRMKSVRKNRVAFRVSLKINRSARKFPYEEVPDHLLLEREANSVISSVETKVSKYEQATDLALSDSNSDLGMDDDICEVGNDF